MVPARRVHVLLRPAGHQEAGVGGARHRRLLLPRRPRGRLLGAGGRRADLTGRAGSGPDGEVRRGGRDPGLAGRPGPRPRPADAVRQHAARGQADLADERRLLAALRVRPGGGRGGAERPDRSASTGRTRWPPRRPPWPARPSRPTPRCSSPTPPCRRGTRRTASCRSSSPARPPARPPASACSGRRRHSRPGPPGRRAGGGRRDGRDPADAQPARPRAGDLRVGLGRAA